MSQLLEPWQELLDVFSQYEAQCTVCTNERWNLQHWLWIIIPAAIPPLPVTKMPRWMDIELDFTDIDLSLDIAYPVFDLNFVPVIIPDAQSPSINQPSIKPMPQFPQIPELNLDVEIPVVELPNLPNLPPPPRVPELSVPLKRVLELFKLVTRIQCQYRQIPIAPEWYVGTKIAHKTEREGYLPEDFLDARGPYPTLEWLEAIRVATHVSLDYDVDFIIDMLKDALKPFENFPINLNQGTESSGAGSSGIPSAIPVQTTSLVPDTSFAQMQKKVDDRFDAITRAIHLDIADNQTIQSDLLAWSQGIKKPEDVASLGTKLPNSAHLANADQSKSHLLALAPSLTQPFLENYIAPVVAPLAVTPLPETVVAP